MFCSNCGAQIPDGSRFCEKCGRPVGGGQPQMNPGAQGGYGNQGNYGARAGGGTPNGYGAPAGAYNVPVSGSGKKGFPSSALVMIILLAAVAAAVYFFLGAEFFDFGSNKPFGGAKIEETVIWETDGLTVTATELRRDTDGDYHDGLLLEIANEGEEDVVVRCASLAVNDAAIAAEMDVEVPAGKTKDGEIEFAKNSLHNSGITTVGEIRVELEACDPDTGMVLERSESFRIKTNKAKKADEPSFVNHGDKIFEGGDVTVSAISVNTRSDSHTDGNMYFLVKNNSKDTVVVALEDATLNGDLAPETNRGVFPGRSEGHYTASMDAGWVAEHMPSKEVTGTICIYDPDGVLLESDTFVWDASR